MELGLRAIVLAALFSCTSCGTPIRDFLPDASESTDSAAPTSCSVAMDTPTTISIENKQSGAMNTISVNTLDGACVEKEVARILAGQSSRFDTFATRILRLRNGFTKAFIRDVVATPEPLVVTVP